MCVFTLADSCLIFAATATVFSEILVSTNFRIEDFSDSDLVYPVYVIFYDLFWIIYAALFSKTYFL